MTASGWLGREATSMNDQNRCFCEVSGISAIVYATPNSLFSLVASGTDVVSYGRLVACSRPPLSWLLPFFGGYDHLRLEVRTHGGWMCPGVGWIYIKVWDNASFLVGTKTAKGQTRRKAITHKLQNERMLGADCVRNPRHRKMSQCTAFLQISMKLLIGLRENLLCSRSARREAANRSIIPRLCWAHIPVVGHPRNEAESIAIGEKSLHVFTAFIIVTNF